MTLRRFASLIVVPALMALLSGCALPLLKKKPPPLPPAPAGTVVAPIAAKKKAALMLTAAADINPDRSGRASPVLVRVYQLRGDAAFRDAQFDPLYDDDQKVLGESYVARYDYTLPPGDKKEIELPLADDAGFIGVVAVFRDILGSASEWRAVTAAQRRAFVVAVAGKRISIAGSEQESR